MNKIDKYFRGTSLKSSITYLRCYRKILFVLMISLGALTAGAQGLDYQWAISTLGKGQAYGFGIVFDSARNVYVSGTFSDTLDIDPGAATVLLVPASLNEGPPGQNVFLAKYDPAGNYLWAKSIRGTSDLYGGIGNHLAIDAAGDLIVVGVINDSADFDPGPGNAILHSVGSKDVFIAKYDGNGNYIWAKNMGSATGAWPCGVAVDALDNISLSGSFAGTMDFDPGPGTASLSSASTTDQDNFVAKYDKNGNYTWARRMGGTGNAAENGNGLAVGPDRSVVTTGAFEGLATFSSTSGTITSAGGRDAYLMKHDSAGAFEWAIPIGGAGGDDYGYDVAVDKEGNVYAAGYFQGQVDFDPGPGTALLTANAMFDGYLAKYDPDGNFLWAHNTGAGFLNMFLGVSTDAIGNVYACGFFSGTADFDPGPNTVNLTAPADMNGFVAKYDAANGHYLWAGVLESTSANVANMLVTDASGTTYVTGSFSNAVDLDPGTGIDQHLSAGVTDVFVLKLACGDTSSTTLNVVTCESSYTLNGDTYNASGTYFQHFPNVTHCDSMTRLQLSIQPMATPVITVNGFQLGTTLSYATYQWIKNGVPIPGATNSTLSVTVNADYQVKVTNSQNCEVTSNVYKVTNATAINDLNGIGRQIDIFPNPANDIINISSPVKVNADLMSLEGRSIRYVKNAQAMPLHDLASGVYILRITDKEGNIIRYEKVVKKP